MAPKDGIAFPTTRVKIEVSASRDGVRCFAGGEQGSADDEYLAACFRFRSFGFLLRKCGKAEQREEQQRN